MRIGSLSTRLTIHYSTLLVVSLALFSFIVFTVFDYALHKEFDAVLLHEAGEFANSVVLRPDGAFDFTGPLVAEHEGLIRTVSNHSVQTFDRSGRLLFRSANVDPAIFPEPVRHDQAIPFSVETRSITGRKIRSYYYPIIRRSLLYGWVQVNAYDGVLNDATRTLATILFGGSVLLIVVAAGIGYLLARRSLMPLREIAAIADRVTARSLSERLRVEEYRDREVVSIGSGLNRLLDRLQSSFTNVSRFTADAAHQLLTPLTVVQQEVEIALRKPRTAEEYQRSLTAVGEDAARLTRIVQGLLALSRTDAGTMPNRVVVDLRDVVTIEARGMERRAEEKRISIELRLPPEPVLAIIDEAHVHTVVSNLIDNAVKYTSAGGSVGISTFLEEGRATIEVADDGIGIAESDRGEIFERFYRSASALDSGADGEGLGLSIVRSLVTANGGSISVAPNTPRGTIFRVELAGAEDGDRGGEDV